MPSRTPGRACARQSPLCQGLAWHRGRRDPDAPPEGFPDRHLSTLKLQLSKLWRCKPEKVKEKPSGRWTPHYAERALTGP